MLRRSEARNDTRSALAAAEQIRKIIETKAKLSGEFNDPETGGGPSVVIYTGNEPSRDALPDAGVRVLLPSNGREAMDVDADGNVIDPG